MPYILNGLPEINFRASFLSAACDDEEPLDEDEDDARCLFPSFFIVLPFVLLRFLLLESPRPDSESLRPPVVSKSTKVVPVRPRA